MTVAVTITSTALVIDSFWRRLADSWGNPDIGGAWHLSSGGNFSVDDARGII